MPNWVSNTLTVSSNGKLDNPEMIEFLSLVGKDVPKGWQDEKQDCLIYDSNGGFSFLAFVSPPADKIEEYYGKKGWENGEEFGNTEYNWYNWNLSEWGCKWDCSDVYVWTEENEDNNSFFQVQFSTPWSPPEQFIDKLIKRFPSLSINLNWEEEQGFGAEWQYDPTKAEAGLTIVEQWDIPDSHADYVERDREDSCNCAWADEPNDWYEDCPDRAEEILRWNKENGIIDPNAQEPDLVYG